MKKVFYSIALFSVIFTFVACNSSNSPILGSWKNTSTKIDKIDVLSETLFEANKSYLEEQKAMYLSGLDTMPDSLKTNYEQIVATIDKQITELSIDTIKANLENNYDLGTFIFEKDSALTIATANDSILGNWKLDEEAKLLTLTIQGQENPLTLKELTESKLVIVQDANIDTLEFKIDYTFEKK